MFDAIRDPWHHRHQPRPRPGGHRWSNPTRGRSRPSPRRGATSPSLRRSWGGWPGLFKGWQIWGRINTTQMFDGIIFLCWEIHKNQKIHKHHTKNGKFRWFWWIWCYFITKDMAKYMMMLNVVPILVGLMENMQETLAEWVIVITILRKYSLD